MSQLTGKDKTKTLKKTKTLTFRVRITEFSQNSTLRISKNEEIQHHPLIKSKL